ncbi:unnamed protein product, partial [Trichogramma brassicae]
ELHCHLCELRLQRAASRAFGRPDGRALTMFPREACAVRGAAYMHTTCQSSREREREAWCNSCTIFTGKRIRITRACGEKKLRAAHQTKLLQTAPRCHCVSIRALESTAEARSLRCSYGNGKGRSTFTRIIKIAIRLVLHLPRNFYIPPAVEGPLFSCPFSQILYEKRFKNVYCFMFHANCVRAKIFHLPVLIMSNSIALIAVARVKRKTHFSVTIKRGLELSISSAVERKLVPIGREHLDNDQRHPHIQQRPMQRESRRYVSHLRSKQRIARITEQHSERRCSSTSMSNSTIRVDVLNPKRNYTHAPRVYCVQESTRAPRIRRTAAAAESEKRVRAHNGKPIIVVTKTKA